MSVEARKIRLLMNLRRSGVTDTALLSAIERIPREKFVPPAFLDKAYDDTALPIGLGQTISQPLVVATMTEALEVKKTHVVLEVGTGSGYQTAILAMLCRRVYSIELLRELQVGAEHILNDLRLHNVTMKSGNGFKGWPEQAPFDRIIVTAAAAKEPPPLLLDQLAVGGIMILPIALDAIDQMVRKIVRTENGLESRDLYPVRFVPLVPETVK
jgi:protein-L-isoaspartate(D-aspartate) O-methyltransferase